MKIAPVLAFLLIPFVDLAGQGVIAPSATEIQPILVGSTIPTITLTDLNNQPFDLMAAVKSKPTVLVYYRGSW